MTDFTSSGHEPATGESPNVLEYEYDAETPPSVALIGMIAVLEDVDPTDVPIETSITLYDHVDPEGLGDGTGDGDVVVSFEISGQRTYCIEMVDNGRINVLHDRPTRS